MSKQKKCTICNKTFTRKWNLGRHLQDVHQIYYNTKKDNMNPEIDDYNSLPTYIDSNNNFRNKNNENNNMNGMIYNKNSFYNHYFSNNTFHNPAYSNDEFYLYPNFNPPIEKEKRLSVDDKIRIQKGLKILQSCLEKIYSPGFVFQIILWLRYCCRSEKK